MAFLHLQKGEHSEVQQKVEEARGLFAKCENRRGEAESLMLAVGSLMEADKTTAAVDRCTKAQDIFREAKDLRGEYESCCQLTDLYLQQEDVEAAMQAAERAVELMQRYANKRLEAQALRLLARVQLEGPQIETAERSALKAKEAASAAQDRAEMTQAQLQLTQVYLALSEGKEATDKGPHPLEKAMRSATEAVALSGRCNDRGLVAVARFVRAQLLHGTSRFDEAQRTAEEALRWFRKAEDSVGEARAIILQGDVALGMGQKDEARAFAEEAKNLAVSIESTRVENEANSLLERIEASLKVAAPVVVQAAIQQAPTQADAGQQQAAAPTSESVAKPEPKGLDIVMVKRKVMELTKNLMAGDDDLENDSPFMEAGMDSLSSVQLMSELGREFQMAMSPSLVFDFPTVNALSDHLVEESQTSASY